MRYKAEYNFPINKKDQSAKISQFFKYLMNESYKLSIALERINIYIYIYRIKFKREGSLANKYKSTQIFHNVNNKEKS